MLLGERAMDLTKVLAQLRQELDHIDAAILSLERLQAKEARRGRPPRALVEIKRARSNARRGPAASRQAQRGRTES
jgi:hypothetical protein